MAAVHLAVVVTAAAFVLWYSAVGRIGPGRAGLFTGVVPIVAAAGGILLGGPTPTPVVWLGVTVVIAGLTLGLAATAPAKPPRRLVKSLEHRQPWYGWLCRSPAPLPGEALRVPSR